MLAAACLASDGLLFCYRLQGCFPKRTFLLPGNPKYCLYAFLGRLRSLHDVSQQIVGQLLHHTDLRGRQTRGIGIAIGRCLGPVEDRLDHRGNEVLRWIFHAASGFGYALVRLSAATPA